MSRFVQIVAEIARREKKSGKKFGGKPPMPPTDGARDSDQISLTDGESRIMKASGGGFEQAYNAQALTDVDTQADRGRVRCAATPDVGQLEPALTSLQQLPAQLGSSEHLLADTGYMSRANVQRCEAAGVAAAIGMHNGPVAASVVFDS